MAIDEPPAGTRAASLGHDRPDVPEYRALATALRERVAGEVQFDEYAQVLYATDGSVYQARPAGVVLPRDTGDVQATLAVAREYDVPVLPRGAGSSLAGQAVGPGCVVIDCSRHMDSILDIDPERGQATVQPGVVLDNLDATLAPYGLQFAPDPASSNRATVGGAMGNNSTGAHSVRYGITDAYVEECRLVLANGEPIHTREVVLDSPEYEAIVSADTREADIYRTVRRLVEDNADEIAERYPSLKRSVSGYNLQKVIYENEDGERVINLSKLVVGAEGTLGVVVEATVGLVPRPEETALALYCFDDLGAALSAVPEALQEPVSAVELMDEEVFRLARASEGYAEYVDPIPEGTAAALLLEWDDELVTPAESDGSDGQAGEGDGQAGEGDGQTQREAFEAAIDAATGRFVDDGAAFDVVEAPTDAAQTRLWKLRKAAIPLLMSMEGDPKPYPFIEDATVPPAELAGYVEQFGEILDAHDTSAAYFAHAGSGTLHIRPILNLKTEDGVEAMRSIAADVTDLVLEHDGAFSGEHGDGLARTEFTPKMYGPDLWAAFKRLKTVFDPEWRCHPGNVVYRDGPDDPGPDSERGVGADMREHLRYGPAYQSIEPQTALDFEDEGGFAHLVELCNGCGTCRQTDTDVMCPTYRASREEIQTTRGRANMLRAAITGEVDPHTERFQAEVLDLCLGCKGCQSDCPTGVDLAKLKAEVKHRHHQQAGAGRRARLFRDIDRYAALGSRLAPLSNRLADLPGADWLAERALDIAPERALPTFASESFVEWFAARGGSVVPEDATTGRVLLVPDPFTNYISPDRGRAAVRVLEAAGIRVRVPDNLPPSGRAAYSLGFLDSARERASGRVDALAPAIENGWSVLAIEPADATMMQDEYRDLLDGEAVRAVSAATYGVMEYLDTARVDERLSFDAPGEGLTYHGHCNQKALGRDHHAVGVLRRAGYEVDPLDSTCCGMAGSFGYEAEHYELSRTLGDMLAGQVEASGGTAVVSGGSCRAQLADCRGTAPPHPVEKLAAALPDGA